MNAIARTSLYYSEGSSDKEYHAEIVEVAGGNVVNFRYGRRGAALTTGTKTSAPVDFVQAKRIYDKLIKEKTSKGYTPDVSGAAYQGTENAGLKTDFIPQLLNPITEEEAMRLVEDDRWAAQEKMDGERRTAHAVAGSATGMNRKGLSVPLPQAIADELQSIETASKTIRVDGEIIGDILHVFDLHVYRGECKLCEAAAVACDGNYPGVFDYEVSGHFGKWFGEYVLEHGDEPSKANAHTWLVFHITAFFTQYMTEEQARDVKTAIDEAFTLAKSNSTAPMPS